MSEELELEIAPDILIFGLSPDAFTLVKNTCGDLNYIHLSSTGEFEENHESYGESSFAIIICGEHTDSLSPEEFGQILRHQCPSTPMFYVTNNLDSFLPEPFLRNGFNKAYILPADTDNFVQSLIDYSPKIGSKRKKNYKAIKLVDIELNTTVSFNTFIYLPLNKRYIRFLAHGQTVTPDKIEKIEKNNINNIYIEKKDASLFYKYTANALNNLGRQSNRFSETEREEKLQEAVRSLFTGIFDQSHNHYENLGNEALVSCQKIISNYITNGTTDNWYNQLAKRVGGVSGKYSHASEVSTFASLLAIGLNHKNPEDLALAGFFHDLSLFDWNEELLKVSQENWSEKDKEKYLKHPKQSIDELKKRQIIISLEASLAIEQHHEKYDGSGFPNKLRAEDISPEAQILSFADQLSYLTRVEEGKRAYSLSEAIDEITTNNSLSPELRKQIKSLFQQENNH